MSEQIVSVDEAAIKSELKELVKTTVEQTLNELLDEEADELVGAERYERSAEREAYRSGHYKRKLVTTSGEIELSVPKLRGATFQTAVIERYRRRETSVEEAMIEMYLAGVSTRRIEDVSEILWGARCLPPRCQTSTRRPSNRWNAGDPVPWRASIPMSTSMGSISSAAGEAHMRTSLS